MDYSDIKPIPGRVLTPEEAIFYQASDLLDAVLDLKSMMLDYSNAIRQIRTKFEVLDSEFAVRHSRNPISSIKTRLKSQSSIIQKLIRRGLPISQQSIESNLTDIAGVRVICSYIDDIYTLADALWAQNDITLISCKDYIKEPKENGYRSLHLIVSVPVYYADSMREVKAEIQIRTIAMDFWASLEHQIKYKKSGGNMEDIVARLKKCADSIAATDAEMQRIRDEVEAAEREPSEADILMAKLKKFDVPIGI